MEINNIEQEFEQMKSADPRKAAELAYVIAMLAKKSGDTEKAKAYATESIQLFDTLSTNTLEECAAQYVTVNNIAIPDIIHSDVVRDRLLPITL